MRTRELWREAARNFAVGASHGIPFLLAFLAIVVLCSSIVSRAVVGVAAHADAFRAAGASVFRMDAPGQVDGAACDRLAEVEGVEAAGATRAVPALRFAALPDLPVPLLEASSGMTALLGVQPATVDAGLLVADSLADSLGVTLPASSFLAGGDRGIGLVGGFADPDDGRDPTLSGAAISVVRDHRPFDSCWVRFWPPPENAGGIMGSVVIASAAGTPPAAVQWNTTLGRRIDSHAEFAAIPFAGVIGVATLVAAVLGYLGVRLRRLEFASALHAGVRRPSLTGIVFAELSLWLVPGCALALVALIPAATLGNPDPPFAAWLAGARVVVAAAGAWMLAAAIGSATVRERHLVRYFQQR
ncbi:MAG: hypothetical protein J0H23_14385 [Micrococcales bacterium]|nr:hypothetical protein [Micrococcales bacterium]OJX68929.1 MAG: hypothetical protein BGO94_10040 [Micrococcales bacterium 72-143]